MTASAKPRVIDVNMHWLPETLFSDESLQAAMINCIPRQHGVPLRPRLEGYDDAAFHPYFEFLNDLDLPVVVHHTPLPVDYGSILDYINQRRQYGRCIAQATAVGRELFSGMFDRFPDLRLSHSMLGGCFFAFVDMLVPKARHAFGDAVDRFETDRGDLRSQLRKNLFFDLSGAPQWGKAQLECAIEVLGEDNILYGGSYPIRRDWFFEGVDTVNRLDVPETVKAKIFSGNAEKLFNI